VATVAVALPVAEPTLAVAACAEPALASKKAVARTSFFMANDLFPV
jgi:hypothetical protein